MSPRFTLYVKQALKGGDNGSCPFCMRVYMTVLQKNNIGLGNGLMPSGNKPLPKPMLTKFCDAWWCYQGPVNYILTAIGGLTKLCAAASEVGR